MLLLIGMTAGGYGQDGSYTEYEIKAAFLYNFAKFVHWPREAFEHDSTALQIGILGRDPFGKVLDRIVEGKRIDNKKLSVRRYHDIDEVDGCHILYVSRSQERWLPTIFKQAHDEHILTVGEFSSFIDEGGIIRLLTVDNKVRFEINPKQAAESKLVISSRLLRLAQNLRYTFSDKKDSMSTQE